MHFADGPLSRVGVVFQPMPEHSPAVGKARIVEIVMGAGIDHQLDGRAFARAAFDPAFAFARRGPIINFANQDNGRNDAEDYQIFKSALPIR